MHNTYIADTIIVIIPYSATFSRGLIFAVFAEYSSRTNIVLLSLECTSLIRYMVPMLDFT